MEPLLSLFPQHTGHSGPQCHSRDSSLDSHRQPGVCQVECWPFQCLLKYTAQSLPSLLGFRIEAQTLYDSIQTVSFPWKMGVLFLSLADSRPSFLFLAEDFSSY